MSEPKGACGHASPVAGILLCDHQISALQAHIKGDYVISWRWYTGEDLRYELLCEQCAEARQAGRPVATMAACADCTSRIEEDIADVQHVGGYPGVRECPRPVAATLIEVDLPGGVVVVDVAPGRSTEREATWFALSAGGDVWEIDAVAGTVERRCQAPVPSEPEHVPWCDHDLAHRLHCAPDGRFAAVVNDYGTKGVLFDMDTGETIWSLDGGSYHSSTVPFSAAFFEFEGRTMFVGRTQWKRLDLIDPTAGEVVSVREFEPRRRDEPLPPHYLDYFHGALYVSPDGQRILDDGWVWTPVGIPYIWSLHAWAGSNPWESDDGESQLRLCQRWYYWDHGMCWIDGERIAVGGVGGDEEGMIAGVRIFDVGADPVLLPSDRTRWSQAVELEGFAGPDGDFFSDGEYLFTSDGDGLSIWSLEGRCRVGRIPGFRPRRHHRRAGQLAEIIPAGGRIRLWRTGNADS